MPEARSLVEVPEHGGVDAELLGEFGRRLVRLAGLGLLEREPGRDHGVARWPLRMVRELLQRLLDALDHRRRRARLEVLDLHTPHATAAAQAGQLEREDDADQSEQDQPG